MQLQRILADGSFANAPAQSAMLRYIVEHTLDGEADRLKEYTLGVEVFGRGDSFDPRTDTIVRVQGRRLRDRLADYYRGPGGRDPVLIELPKGHYIPVFLAGPGPATPAAADEPGDEAAPSAGTAAKARYGHRARPWLLAMAALAVVLAAVRWWPAQAPADPAAMAPHSTALAVLPFADMSRDGDQGYFADGLSEELIHRLSQSRALRVVARTSSFSFRGSEADIPTIARTLGVSHVLEGSLRRDGERMRITVQLIDAASGMHVWSETYDRRPDDLLAVQGEIAAAVAYHLQVELGPAPGPTHAPDPEAYARYLEGRFLLHRRGPGELERAEQLLREATRLSPGFAAAWAELAGAYYLRTMAGELPWDAGMQRLGEAARHAVALDPGLATARLRLGNYLSWAQGRRDEAMEQYRMAMILDPDNPLGLAFAAGAAHQRHQHADAIALGRRALAHDPLNVSFRHNLALMLAGAAKYEEAEIELDRLVELHPAKSEEAALLRSQLRLLQGRPEQALGLLRGLPAGPQRSYSLALVQAGLGRRAEAEAALAAARTADMRQRGRFHPAVARAEILALLGDRDAAFAALDAVRVPHASLPAGRLERDALASARTSLFLAPLRDDPRWQRWLEATLGELEPIDFGPLLQEPGELRATTAGRTSQSP